MKVECDYEILDNLTRITRISEKDISKTCTLCRQETNGRTHRGLYRCKLYRKQFNADANGAVEHNEKVSNPAAAYRSSGCSGTPCGISLE